MTEGKPKHDRSKWKHEDAAHRTARTHKRRADELAAAKWLGYDSMSTVVKVIVAAHQNVLRNSEDTNAIVELPTKHIQQGDSNMSMPNYHVDTRNTSRYEIEEEIVSGAYGNTSVQEQLDLYNGDVTAAAQAVADFYEGEDVQYLNFDDSPLDVADYAASYLERNA